MSADVTVWVEIEYTTTFWRESYGVVAEDGLENVHLNGRERPTGRVSYTNPEMCPSCHELLALPSGDGCAAMTMHLP